MSVNGIEISPNPGCYFTPTYLKPYLASSETRPFHGSPRINALDPSTTNRGISFSPRIRTSCVFPPSPLHWSPGRPEVLILLGGHGGICLSEAFLDKTHPFDARPWLFDLTVAGGVEGRGGEIISALESDRPFIDFRRRPPPKPFQCLGSLRKRLPNLVFSAENGLDYMLLESADLIRLKKVGFIEVNLSRLGERVGGGDPHRLVALARKAAQIDAHLPLHIRTPGQGCGKHR